MRRPGIAIGHRQAVLNDYQREQQRAEIKSEAERFEKDRAARRAEVEALIPKAPEPVAPPAPILRVRPPRLRPPQNPPALVTPAHGGSLSVSEAQPPASAASLPQAPRGPEVSEGSVVLSPGEWRAVSNLMALQTELAIAQAKEKKS
jgi:hypothetical protein